ncbi:MAG: molybdenum cofactor biosynthesis protein MoaE [alpha proteobacterium HIMB59]|jgi:molybdopterin synthase catalytic subunit|nr:MAG: molybdenum cofactor biosynthesis protein MoaE [alpha proteobacterium HIMB59]|tara:strand:- start:2288 stop:2752 length:465 start_codon:yes stop_codon:yes gene_type:complete
MIKITNEDFNLEEEFLKISSKKNGAYSFFLGTVRDDILKNKKKIDGIFLECYQDLAHQQLTKIRNQAIQQWQLTECNIVHRIGSLGLGEKIVLVITSSKHRANSISACEYVIDNLKANVAFWKFNIFGENQEAVEFKKKDLDKFLQWSNIVKTN